MNQKLSSRLRAIVGALPLKPGVRILEIGCGPGAMAREISQKIGKGHVLATDRSATAIKQAKAGSSREIKSGNLSFRQVSAEEFELLPGEKPFDFAVAVRVGAFDGRYPELGAVAYQKIKKALKPRGKLFIDGGKPLKIFKPEKK